MSSHGHRPHRFESCYRRFFGLLAQLGERQTEDLKVPSSILGLPKFMLGVGFGLAPMYTPKAMSARRQRVSVFLPDNRIRSASGGGHHRRGAERACFGF